MTDQPERKHFKWPDNAQQNDRDNDLPKLLRAIAKGTNAQETNQDIILNAAADEIERLRTILTQANNVWRHEFLQGVDNATAVLFRKLGVNNTDPWGRKS